MTASQDETHRRQAMDFGCVEYLNKPFHADQLIMAITKAIGCASDLKSEEGEPSFFGIYRIEFPREYKP